MKSVFHHKGKSTELLSDVWFQAIISHRFEGVIFDCDGTLVESSEAHFRCMQAAAADQGHIMSPVWYQSRTGLDRTSLFKAFAVELAANFDVQRACRVSIDAYADFVCYAAPISISITLLRDLKPRLPIAVATNAEKEVAERSLAAINIDSQVDTLVSISDGVLPKPSPDLFLRAAGQLGIEPKNALVIEDSPQGVTAALAAGMSVIHLQQESNQ